MDTDRYPRLNTPGYKQLDHEQEQTIVGIRALGETLGATVHQLKHRGHCDQRWLAIAETQLQQGLMALVRAVTKPDFF